MESAEIGRRFLGFYEQRGHTVVPSASLLLDDPTLLFVNAGMVPFKPYFLGQQTPPYPRATSVQKCVRTTDIEEVGKTTRHGSFFQMNGNFSFGDYFKEKAIPYAWELLTAPVGDGGFGFDEGRLWITVYEDDDEAADIWRRDVGLPEHRIQRRGQADNFWGMGVPGPCGPCSEIYYDRGPERGREGGPVADEERYLEVWNLVFMQYDGRPSGGKGEYEVLGDLPAKNIDTGMGLERMATLLQGVDNLYEIDTTRVVLDRATALTGRHYGADHGHDVALRVVADHTRTAVMLIGDGVTPGNEGRGYVLRRMMRRAIRTMRLLGSQDPTMRELVDATILAMGPQYPELAHGRERIEAVAQAEEQAFLSTLRAGTTLLDTAVAATKRSGGQVLGGAEAFRLHDTYGFPIDLTLEMAAEQGVAVDEDGFRRLMAEQRRRAKADARAKKTGHADQPLYRGVADALTAPVEFTGYREVRTEAVVRGLVADAAAVTVAVAGDQVELVLDRTPFYAEGGGQLADQGRITLDGAQVDVLDVQSPFPGLVLHRGVVRSGEVLVGARAWAEVDVERRKAISRSHTATHMVHKAFREALGETATQAGSENAPGRFRFDFSASAGVPPSLLRDVEARVNSLVVEDLVVHAEVLSQAEAVRSGAMALFGEKYGDRVRVVTVGEWARELCGGTHALRSGQLGVVTLLGESSIGQGVRRVEALVGADAYRFLAREHVIVARLCEALKARPQELPERVASLLESLRTAEKDNRRMRSAQMLADLEGMLGDGVEVGDVRVWTFQAPDDLSGAELRRLTLQALGGARGERPAAVVATSAAHGKVAVVAAVNPPGQRHGLAADRLLAAALPHVGGRGGGKADVAQGGGSDAAGIPAAFDAVREAVRASQA